MSFNTNKTSQTFHWNSEDRKTLLEYYNLFGNCWKDISNYIGRECTARQCRYEMLRILGLIGVDEHWKLDELKLLLSLIKEIGKKWIKISSLMPKKTPEMCQAKYIVLNLCLLM